MNGGVESRLRELRSADEVRARIGQLGGAIAEALASDAARIDGTGRVDGASRPPLFVVIAEGARRFAAALVAQLARHGLAVETLVVRARRSAGQELRTVEIEPFDAAVCGGRAVLVVDDIADEGETLAAVAARVRAAAPASLRTAVLVSKHARRKIALPLDFVGFDVDDGWVVGFGMDLDGRLRELDHLAVVDVQRLPRPPGGP